MHVFSAADQDPLSEEFLCTKVPKMHHPRKTRWHLPKKTLHETYSSFLSQHLCFMMHLVQLICCRPACYNNLFIELYLAHAEEDQSKEPLLRILCFISSLHTTVFWKGLFLGLSDFHSIIKVCKSGWASTNRPGVKQHGTQLLQVLETWQDRSQR